ELIPALLAVASLNGRATVAVQNAETRPQNGSVTLNSSFNAFIRIACALCPLSRHDRWAVIPEFSIEIPSLRAVRSFNSRSVLPVAFPVSKPLLGAVWIDDGGPSSRCSLPNWYQRCSPLVLEQPVRRRDAEC